MIRIARSFCFGYKVTKKTNGPEGQPLPNMTMFYLTNDEGKQLSFWNDLPFDLKGDSLTCCIEVPKQLSNKYEVIKDEKNHPLRQDTKKNVFSRELQLRYYAKFPLFNYGFIPRTWEQNLVKDSLGLYGDNDPIDVCDLSQEKKEVGGVYRAKVLGCFCLIDQGEVDWKVLTVDEAQAERQKIKSIQDYPKQQIQAVMQWFKIIKTFDGKQPNTIAHNEKIFNKDETLSIIHNTHQQWKKLTTNQQQIYTNLRYKFHI